MIIKRSCCWTRVTLRSCRYMCVFDSSDAKVIDNSSFQAELRFNLLGSCTVQCQVAMVTPAFHSRKWGNKNILKKNLRNFSSSPLLNALAELSWGVERRALTCLSQRLNISLRKKKQRQEAKHSAAHSNTHSSSLLWCKNCGTG